MNKNVFEVPKISCNHCVNTIEMELSDLEGVISVKADSETKKVEVEYGDPATDTTILDLLEEINYPASI